MGHGSGTTATTLATPTWPSETDIIYVHGSGKVKMTLQTNLLQLIFRSMFEHVHSYLVFNHTFPTVIVIPGIVQDALTTAIKARMFPYNASRSILQCLIADDKYSAKMIRLVSSIASNTTYLYLFSAMRVDSHLPRGGQGSLCTDHPTAVYSPPIAIRHTGVRQ
jgi:hypothetical protein